jgi:F0F1-type ATP synthase alpha subunit
MDVAVEKTAQCMSAYLEHLRYNHADLMKNIGETGKFSPEQEKELRDAIDKFKSSVWQSSADRG